MRHKTLLGRRRALLAVAAAFCSPALAATPDPAPGSKARALIIAGPAGGHLDRWADLLAAPIGNALPAHIPLIRRNVGGLDGVTGANRFEAGTEPDGSTALLVPGSAALSWLVGEPRAKFDPARWVPLWASTGSAVLVSRAPVVSGRTLSVAAASPVGPELPMLLALDLLGVHAVLSTPALAEAKLVQGPPAALEAEEAAGFRPVLTLGMLGQEGTLVRDPSLPDVPTVFERLHVGTPVDLVSALRATSTAVQLDAALVLPPLTPAAPVALWRHACAGLESDAAISHEAEQQGIHLVSASRAASCTSHSAVDAGVLLALRRWLSTRYNWVPA